MKKVFSLILLTVLFSCQQPSEKTKVPFTKADFETTIKGKKVSLFHLQNANGMEVYLTNYGAKLVSILVPDKEGKYDDVTLGFKSIKEYEVNDPTLGAIVGPYANRIANAKFDLNGKTYNLEVNDHKANLHSGTASFYRQVYDAKQIKTTDGSAVELSLESPDGDFGFPGNKNVKVTYMLKDDNSLSINYEVTTDKPCPFNMTNHSYFNLKGEGNGNILDQLLMIDSDSTTEILDSELIPTGKIISIKGTDMDFTTPCAVGKRINSDFLPIKVAGGYDHNYILNKDQNGHEMTLAASDYDPASGRFMEIYTTEPAIQIYTGNFMDGTLTGKSGNKYGHRFGICFETQHYPDSPNHPNFPNTILNPGETLHSTTIFKFSVK